VRVCDSPFSHLFILLSGLLLTAAAVLNQIKLCLGLAQSLVHGPGNLTLDIVFF
jgi:hypothetical protein